MNIAVRTDDRFVKVDGLNVRYLEEGSGVPAILLSYGYTPVPARDLGADAVLDDFAELPQALRRLGL